MVIKEVASSNIAGVGYDPETRKLEVHFRNGGRYLLHDVEPEIHEQFMKAQSPGGFYAKNLRGFYKIERLGDEE